MGNNQKDNKNIIIITLAVLLAIVTIALILVLVFNINSNKEKTIEKLSRQVEKIKEEDKTELINYLDQTPEEYIETMCTWIGKDLPMFKDINEASPEWIWGNVKGMFSFLDKEEIDYDEINDVAKILYGNNFTIEFPKEGGYGLTYNKEMDQYTIDEEYYDGDYLEFAIKDVKEDENQVTLDIVEYRIEEQTNEDGNIDRVVLYDINDNEIKSYTVGNYEELLKNYAESMNRIKEDCKELDANLRIVLELNEDEIYNIVSITEI